MGLDPKHIVSLKGKEFVVYAGLLDLAHQNGLLSIEVNLIQYPAPENGQLAIAQATANFEGGRFFTDLGDCGPTNCTPMIAPHACRMASTRAKGRALRDALNIGVAMFEELGPDAAEGRSESARTPQGAGRREETQRARHDPEDHAERKAAQNAAVALCETCGAEVPASVATSARQRWNTVLCLMHGRERRVADKEAPAQMQGA